MMGDFEGGALELADGRRFDRKYRWYRYNGALTAHGVAPFTGERLTCVLYREPPTVLNFTCVGGEPKPADAQASKTSIEHPAVGVMEDPAVTAERERRLEIQRKKAILEWRQAAAQKAWGTVRAGLEVYRHCGERITEDPRLKEDYKQKVVVGLRLLPKGA